MNSDTTKIVCRKCGGPHFTMKCGKEETIKPDEKVNIHHEKGNIHHEKGNIHHEKGNIHHKREDYHYKREDTNYKNNFKKRGYKVKMSNLPSNMLEEELLELLYDWGDLVRLKLLSYAESSCAYIEFISEEQRTYLIEALHRTPFEHQMITVEKLDD
jgi:hypothetical protein